MKLRRWPGFALIVVLLSAAAWLWPAGPAPRVLRHDAYVWQRQWDEPLRDALRESRSFIGGLRVLGLQRDAQGGWVEPGVDLAELARDGRRVVLVVRIDGSAPDWPGDELQQRLLPLLQRWQQAGITADLELDHDCATARLPVYAQQLAALRRALPPRTALSITALPAWRQAPALDAVLAQVDLSVLQLHAVQSPAQGLFDAALAQGWVRDWARRSGGRPFLVALPAYGARLKLDADGALQAVESEQPLPRQSAQARELRVDPRAVAQFIADLARAAPPGFDGIAWFRLPRAGDTRAWALGTLRAVSLTEPLQSLMQTDLVAQQNGAWDIWLRSSGTLDAPLPARLALQGDCAAGDAVGGYRLLRESGKIIFATDGQELLRAGTGRRIGWLRCTGPPSRPAGG
jgi:Protein of unknown function (DUF3142)